MVNNFFASAGRTEFEKERKNARRRDREREKGRNRLFVAWDSEGFDVDGEHRLMQIVNSEYMSMQADNEGLTTDDCFDFLLTGAEMYPDAIHIMYGMSYDVNMMLKGVGHELTYNNLQMLVNTGRCRCAGYSVEYVPRRYLRISEYEEWENEEPPYNHKKGPLIRSISVWDVMQFFQMSFLDALNGMFTPEELKECFRMELLETQKKRRSQFTMEDLDSGLLEKYSFEECIALVELMNRFRANCHDSGIHLNRYDGAGAGAASLMREHGLGPIIKQAQGIIEADVNKGLFGAIQVAYGMGHVEQFMIGHTRRKVHHYDRRAAFGSEMVGLCDLSDGRWTHHIYNDDFPWLPIFDTEDWSLYKVYWDYREESCCIMPFFYRRAGKPSHVYYPPQGYTWVWSPELRAALSFRAREYIKGCPTVVEQWKFHPYSDRRPFAFVKDVYAKRLEYRRKGLHGQEIGIKSSINAIPGKLAQTVGYYDGGGDRDRMVIPAYFNLAYAGLITSAVRASVFEAMMQAPFDILGVATDGLWSFVPLELPIGEGLGEWKYEELSGFTSVQPGVYFTKRKEGGKRVQHYRGFNQETIDEKDIIKAW